MRPSPASRDNAALLGLLLLTLALFSGAVFGGRVFFERDINSYWYPEVETFVRVVAEGAWPLWDPSEGFGLPMLADPYSQVLYPLTWLNLVLPPAAYYELFVVGHTFLAGAGLFLLARRLEFSALSAFVSAAAFSASGPLLSAASVHHFAAAAWMPWVLLALDHALERQTAGAALVLGAVAAAQALAGSPDLCLLTSMAALVQALLSGRLRGRLRSAARTGLFAVAFAVVLSAAQWLPAAAIVRYGSRLRMSPADAMHWSLHPLSLADVLVPRLFADLPLSHPLRAALFDSREPFLSCLYLGLPACLLAALGLLAPIGRARWLAPAGFAFFLLGALGRHTPLYPLLMNVPSFALIRFPVKLAIPAALFWGLLVGAGLELWQRPWGPAERRRAAAVLWIAAGLALGLLPLGRWVAAGPERLASLLASPGHSAAAGEAFALAGRKLMTSGLLAAFGAGLLVLRRARPAAPSWLTAVLVVFVSGDLTRVGRGVNGLAPAELMARKPPVVARLGPDTAERRIYAFQYSLVWLNQNLVRIPLGWEPGWAWALGTQDRLQPPIGARWGLSGSFDGDVTGLAPLPLSALSQLVARAEGTSLGLRLLQMGSVDYVVALHEIGFPGLQKLAELPSVFSPPVRLFRVPEPVPRAYVVGRARIAGSDREAFLALQDPGLDIRREAILERGAPLVGPRADFEGVSRIVRRRADALAIEVSSNTPGYLVIVEAYHPGWKATVDGTPAPVLRANLLFRAVPVPAGAHRVELRYRPAEVAWGGLLSAAGVLGGLAFWEVRRRSSARVGTRAGD